MAGAAPQTIIGWEEWVALPELGLPAIKAKVDTGAKTSALHAFRIEVFGPADAPMVRFGVHPVPGRSDIEVTSVAPIVDRRDVTSSNGDSETRYVIRTRVALGDLGWPIDVTLANRETMSHRMLLGRQALRDGMLVDATQSFVQLRLSHKIYRGGRRPRSAEAGERETLRIALLARTPDSQPNRRIAAAARALGHDVAVLEPDHLALGLGVGAALLTDRGRPVAPVDVVIPRVAASAFSAAIVRQLELGGAVSLNPAAALDRVRETTAMLHALAREGVGLPFARLDAHGLRGVWRDEAARQPHAEVLVVGGQAVAALSSAGMRTAPTPAEAHAAELAAAALGLRLAAVGVAAAGQVVAVQASPRLGRFDGDGTDLAERIVAASEALAIARRRPDGA